MSKDVASTPQQKTLFPDSLSGSLAARTAIKIERSSTTIVFFKNNRSLKQIFALCLAIKERQWSMYKEKVYTSGAQD